MTEKEKRSNRGKGKGKEKGSNRGKGGGKEKVNEVG